MSGKRWLALTIPPASRGSPRRHCLSKFVAYCAQANIRALEQLRAELRESSGEAKANVKGAIKAQQRKLEALDDRIGKTLALQKAEFEARLATLREQQTKARESKRQQIEARMAELKAAHEARKAKLEEARRLAKSSVEATVEALKP